MARIGIFDSGVGGLSIANEIHQLLPDVDIDYIADQGFAPYGQQPTEVIIERCHTIVNKLVKNGCDLIVIACNTATVNAVALLRKTFDVPIVGVEPGVKPAAYQSLSKHILVLATQSTLNSESYQQLKAKYQQNAHFYDQPCPAFVELVERREHLSQDAHKWAEKYLEKVFMLDCDTVILGCTHFVFLLPILEKILPSHVRVINTANAVAKQAKIKLMERQPQWQKQEGKLVFMTSAKRCPSHDYIAAFATIRLDSIIQI
ncbi:glutamate racemase [Thalassotalea agarivorans]|uniref:Glutamate racemase n=1 Tax=Thalassotalea agarivorans TaxID=349064 RepID=A0A1I0E3L6_THASX|nr:glutamate racemase [Thalassotalea agarivorans]SET39223.1 glutamate racemase [Thalassotalea agarivorans]